MGYRGYSDGVFGGSGGVLAAARGGPGEGPVGVLFDVPAGVLLEPVLVPALRAGVAQARPAALVERDVVLEVRASGGPLAHRAGAGGVPDLGQVPQLDAGIVALGLVPVVTVPGRDRVDGEDPGPLPGDPGGEPPGAVPAGRPGPGPGDGEPGRVGAGRGLAAGFGAGAGVPGGASAAVGHGQAPRRLRVRRRSRGEVAGQPRIDRAEAGQF